MKSFAVGSSFISYHFFCDQCLLFRLLLFISCICVALSPFNWYDNVQRDKYINYYKVKHETFHKRNNSNERSSIQLHANALIVYCARARAYLHVYQLHPPSLLWMRRRTKIGAHPHPMCCTTINSIHFVVIILLNALFYYSIDAASGRMYEVMSVYLLCRVPADKIFSLNLYVELPLRP